jgi:hypothetical protein
MEENKVITELLKDGLSIKAAIQIAKIVSNAPEEHLPMILDTLSQAGVEISGVEAFDSYCTEEADKIRNVREMCIIKINKVAGGKCVYSVPIRDPETKKITRRIYILDKWRKLGGVNDKTHYGRRKKD